MKTDFTTWYKRMFSSRFEEDKDFIPILRKITVGRPSVNYALTLDCAKEISMLQRTDKCKQTRLYFIKVEKEYKAITTSPLSSLDLLELQLKLFKEQQAEM